MTDVKQLPKEFLAEMKLLLGDEYHRYLKSFEEGWKPGLRVNTRKLEPGQLSNGSLGTGAGAVDRERILLQQ